MKAVIVGCGRVGAGIADELDRAGWQVLIIDCRRRAFDRLPADVRRAPPSGATGPTRTPSAAKAPRAPTCSSP